MRADHDEWVLYEVHDDRYGTFCDFKRQGKWELSFWDENFDGHWTLVGYHPDGGLIPSRFESYEAFKKRTSGAH